MDLFKKDFLIVPINKNSHWYLVIICYPYLAEPQYVDIPEKMDLTNSETMVSEKKLVNLDLNEQKSQQTESNPNANNKKKTEKKESKSLTVDSDHSADEADEDDSNFSTSIFTSNKENNKTCSKMYALFFALNDFFIKRFFYLKYLGQLF